jgi:hypothetical protein
MGNTVGEEHHSGHARVRAAGPAIVTVLMTTVPRTGQ